MEPKDIRETMKPKTKVDEAKNPAKADKDEHIQTPKNPKKLEIVGIARAFGDGTNRKDYYVGYDGENY